MQNVMLKNEDVIENENPNANPGPEPVPDWGQLVFRPYQIPIFLDHRSGIVILHWARQIGKSYILAAWAVRRLMFKPGGRLVTVLSNSRENGAEFLLKCAEICRLVKMPCSTEVGSPGQETFEDLRMELRMPAYGKIGRIKVLAANPRTARGFSGDLILDEFAFHEDSAAIWAAAEPILAANKNFLCRIASTGNGRHNYFYKMAHGAPSFYSIENENIEQPTSNIEHPSEKKKGNIEHRTSNAEHRTGSEPTAVPNSALGVGCSAFDLSPSLFPLSASGFFVSKVTRTDAYKKGIPVYDSRTRQPITPKQARELALDKRAYDQNFECSFADESFTLLTHALISAAERDDVGIICEQDWSADALALLRRSKKLYAGFDVGRTNDLSVLTVLEKADNLFRVRGILRMREMRLPDQETRLGAICRLPNFERVEIDLTGIGLGLFEYAQKSFGSLRIHGVNFASTVPVTKAIARDGGKRETVRVTEAMATEVLRVYEDRRIEHPRDERLREDLRKPEKVTSPGGRVSIAATRDEAGHADHFWSLALALEAAAMARPPGGMETFKIPRSTSWEDRKFLI